MKPSSVFTRCSIGPLIIVGLIILFGDIWKVHDLLFEKVSEGPVTWWVLPLCGLLIIVIVGRKAELKNEKLAWYLLGISFLLKNTTFLVEKNPAIFIASGCLSLDLIAGLNFWICYNKHFRNQAREVPEKINASASNKKLGWKWLGLMCLTMFIAFIGTIALVWLWATIRH